MVMFTYVCLGTLWVKVEHLSYNIQDVLTSLLWRNILLNAIGEEHHTNLVVVLHCAEGDGSSYLGSHHRLHTLACAEIERARDINQQHNGKFAFLLKHFHVRLAETCCDIPIYVANVIAKLILANLGKAIIKARDAVNKVLFFIFYFILFNNDIYFTLTS